jgi:hypothetical protein
MCRNFTYEVVGQRRRLKAIKKIVPQKLNFILIFVREFFKYFFGVLHEASSSWLKYCRAFQGHPVYHNKTLYYHMSVFNRTSVIYYFSHFTITKLKVTRTV